MGEARLTWIPRGAVRFDGVPELGALLADNHAVWEVLDVVDLDHDPDWPGARTHELVLGSRTGPESVRRVTTGRYSAWWVYQNRVPLCPCCQEPAPCRARVADDTAQRILGEMMRFSQPGRCPACLRQVTSTQRSAAFSANLRVPLGPSVSFHLDEPVCRNAAAAYERELDLLSGS